MHSKQILAIVLSLCLCGGCATNPITGEDQFMLIPQEQDVEIGRKYAPEIEKELGGKIKNESLQNYTDSIGQKLARVCHNPNLEYHFVALNDKTMNAFALPGGYIFVTKGMLEKLETEAQLAAILSHEIVHVVARHSAAAMSREIGIGILLSAVISDKAPQGVSTAANLTRQIVGLQYSRKDEKEADLGGMEYMVRAGYNPHGMLETMQMLHNQNQLRPVEFLSTHPSPENRIEYLTQKIQTSYQESANARVGRQDYQTIVIAQLKD